jgi:GntR family transcriptional regulator
MTDLKRQELDRSSKVPLYDQIRILIENAIQAGDLKEGDYLPNERMLQELYSVSRSTVRQALQKLEIKGYIRRMQGDGTQIISRAPADSPKIITSFTEDILSRGLTPSSKTLCVEAVCPPPSIRESFKIKEGQAVWYVRRLRLADDTPIALNDLYIPPQFEFRADELFTMHSYYQLMDEKFGIEPHDAMDQLKTCQADEFTANHLNVNPADTLIKLERSTFDMVGEAIEYTYICFIPKYFEYKVFLKMRQQVQT